MSTNTRNASLRSMACALLVACSAVGALAHSTDVVTKKGAIVDARLSTAINSKTSHDGDAFSMTVTDSLFHRHPELKGAVIDGHIEHVTPASATHKATLSIIFDDITYADGQSAPLSVTVAKMSQIQPKTHTVRDAGIIVASAVTGHMISKKTGHGGGTIAGAAAGFALATSLKSNIELKRGTIIQLRLLRDLVAPLPSPSAS